MNDNIPYWEYMRDGGGKEPHRDLELSTIEMSAIVRDLNDRVKKLEEEVTWLRKDEASGMITGQGIMD